MEFTCGYLWSKEREETGQFRKSKIHPTQGTLLKSTIEFAHTVNRHRLTEIGENVLPG